MNNEIDVNKLVADPKPVDEDKVESSHFFYDEKMFYTPGEVASFFRVTTKTVAKWAADGKISSILLPGKRRRYPVKEINRLLEGEDNAG